MKKICIVFAVIFAIATIVLYIVSINKLDNDTARVLGTSAIINIQATVFCAACAVMFVVNCVGAMILSVLEDNGMISSSDREETKETPSKPQPPQDPTVVIATGPKDVMFCDICGIRQNKLNKVMLQTRKGAQEKRLCDNCLAENKDKLV